MKRILREKEKALARIAELENSLKQAGARGSTGLLESPAAGQEE